MRIFVPFLFFLLLFLQSIFAYEFKLGEFEQIQEVAQEIIKRYPPNEYVYVGVGRSPTPLVAFLQQTGRDAINFPISGARNYPQKIWNLGLFGSSVDKKKLQEHFKRFIFDRVLMKERKVLLIDYTESGKSLKFVTRALKNFVKANPLTSEIKALALVGDGKRLAGYSYQDGVINPNLSGIDDSIKLKPLLQDMFHTSAYDTWAEFNQFDVWKHDWKDLKQRDSYFRLRVDLQKQIKSLPLQNPCAEIF